MPSNSWLGEGRRHLELVQAVERVEQAALHLVAALRVVLLGDAALHLLLELLEALHAEGLGELVIDGEGAGRLDRLRGDLEGGILAGEVGRRIVRREGDIDGLGLALGDADELILEAGNEAVGAEHHLDVLGAAALEGLAFQRADEGHGDAVAGLGGAGLRRIGPVGVGDPGDRLVDLGVGHREHRLLQGDRLEVAERDRRQHFDIDGVGEVGLAVDDVLDRILVLRQLDLGLHGELEAALLDDLAIGLVHRLVDHLGEHRLAIEPLQVRHRHLAGPEAVDAHAVLHLGQPGVGLGVEFGGGKHHAEFALQPIGGEFGDLHRYRPSSCRRAAALLSVGNRRLTPDPRGLRRSSGRQPCAGVLVRAEGLEPPRLSSREPKSRASTSSATPANAPFCRGNSSNHRRAHSFRVPPAGCGLIARPCRSASGK